ncbi:MAG: EF-P lysine aminoacylase EpmA [Victivallales bacterium]
MSAKPEIVGRLSSLKPRLEKRAAVFSALRDFFNASEFLEVTTPARIIAPAPEPHINAVHSDGCFLRTSPELEMKCMLASGYRRIFQLGPCFRKNEKGRLHREEFTMLEWYETGADYLALVDFTRRMLESVSEKALGGPKCIFRGTEIDFTKAETITLESAFAEFAGKDLLKIVAADDFEEVLVAEVEPKLPKDRPVFLKDYPAKFAALSRLGRDNPDFAERWELYLGGVEIANAFGELVDVNEQKKRFELARLQKVKCGEDVYPENRDFLEALEYGIPACAGCAMGMDRLVMVLCDACSIDEIMV